MKKRWQKPELIILCRSNPDEVLLGNCKSQTHSIGPVAANNKCDALNGNCHACQAENNPS
jgi:hypothetical protein